tara:strand:- start:1314 stop:4010 length:2697 start_codon:yes stop_codon:yes gene_type:complete
MQENSPGNEEKKIKTTVEVDNTGVKETESLHNNILRTLEAERDVTADIVSYQAQLMKLQQKTVGAVDMTTDLARANRDLKKEEIKLEKQKGKISDEEFKRQSKRLQKARLQLDHSVAMNDVIQDVSKNMAPVAAFGQDMADSLDSFVKTLPGGAALSKAFGIDDLNDRLTSVVNTISGEYISKISELDDAGQRVYTNQEAITSALEAGGSAMKALLTPGLMFAAAIAGIALIFASISKQAKELATQTGVTFSQAKALNDQARQIQSSYSTQLATVEDISAVQKEQLAVLGSAALVNTEIAGSVADMGKAFGYGAEQAGKTHAALLLIGASQKEANEIQLKTSADALKAGVNVAAVQKDIAENAASALKYLGGAPDAIGKAAIKAAKLGVSLKTMVGVADALLDIEGSLTAQFEFQALTGSEINLDLARQKALQGDIAGATEEVMKNVKSSAEFDQMGVFAKQALAKATGVSVEELQKSLLIQEKMGSLTDEQKAAAANLGLSAAEMKEMSAEELKNRLAQQQSLDKAGAAFESIKNQLVTALLPLAEAFGSVFTILGPILKTIGKVLGIAFLPLKWAGQALEFLFDLMERFKGTSIALGTILAGNYLYQKLGTKEQQKALALKVQDKVQTGLINAQKFLGLGYDKLSAANQGKRLSLIGLEYMKTAAMNTLRLAGVGLQLAWNTAKGIGNALLVWSFGNEQATNAVIGARLLIEQSINAVKAVGNTLSLIGKAIGLASIGAAVASAAGWIFSAFGMIPFGLGIPLAIAAVAGLFTLVAKATKVGDVQSPAKGKTMISTKEGGLFETSKNDDVAAGPGILSKLAGAASNPLGAIGGLFGGGDSDKGSNEALIAKLDELILAVKTPPPVYIGNKAVTELSSALQINDSFQTTTAVAGEGS